MNSFRRIVLNTQIPIHETVERLHNLRRCNALNEYEDRKAYQCIRYLLYYLDEAGVYIDDKFKGYF